MERKRWYQMPDVRQVEKKLLREELKDHPDVIFMAVVVGVLWTIWFGITWGD